MRALYEILLNAIFAAGEEGSVSISTGAAPQSVQIIIKDDGSGIPEDAVKRIFDPFFSTREKARGLGLTAALAIMRQLGGAIDLIETGPTGTTMAMRIPVGELQ